MNRIRKLSNACLVMAIILVMSSIFVDGFYTQLMIAGAIVFLTGYVLNLKATKRENAYCCGLCGEFEGCKMNGITVEGCCDSCDVYALCDTSDFGKQMKKEKGAI